MGAPPVPTIHTTRSQLLLPCPPQIICPAQVLVLDQHNGPADLLMDTVSRLTKKEVTITRLDDARVALQRLDHEHYDLLVIGAGREAGEPLSVMPYVQIQHPELPVILVGHCLSRATRASATFFKVRDAFLLPQTACHMKRLVQHISTRYF